MTGDHPLAPNIRMARSLGARIDMPPPTTCSPGPEARSMKTYSVADAPMTRGTKPKSAPSCRNAGPNPHSPGLARPHM